MNEVRLVKLRTKEFDAGLSPNWFMMTFMFYTFFKRYFDVIKIIPLSFSIIQMVHVGIHMENELTILVIIWVKSWIIHIYSERHSVLLLFFIKQWLSRLRFIMTKSLTCERYSIFEVEIFTSPHGLDA
jgi:hypothetical protein